MPYSAFPNVEADDLTHVETSSSILFLIALQASHPCMCQGADASRCEEFYDQSGVGKNTLTEFFARLSASLVDEELCQGTLLNSTTAAYAGFITMLILWLLDCCLECCCLPRARRRSTGRSWFYFLTGGCIDALAAPGQMLWNVDQAFHHATAFCLSSALLANSLIGGNFGYIAAFQLAGLPAVLHMCRRYRYPTVGAGMGLIFCTFLCVVFGLSLHCSEQHGLNFDWVQYVVPMLCVIIMLECYGRILYQHLFNRKVALSLAYKWRHLDRRPYVQRLLREVKLPELTGASHFFRGLVNDSEYQLSPRVLSACCFGFSMVLSLCFAMALFTNLAGVFFEYLTSGGHCCSGKPCDPTPTNMLWTPDVFGVGIGLSMGDPSRCDELTGVARNTLGPLVGTCSVIATAVVFISAVYFLGSHRDHMLKMYKGYRTPKMKRPAPTKAILATIKFSGAQVLLMLTF